MRDTPSHVRSGQFFIIATVLISGALLFIVTMLVATADLAHTDSLAQHDTSIAENLGSHAEEMWWHNQWAFRTSVAVEEREGAAVTEEPVPLILPASRTEVNDDCSDIRVIQDGEELPWNETTGCDIDTYADDTRAVAHFKMDEGGGQWANDSSGNENHGQIVGAEWVGGRYDTALEFDGDNEEYVEIGTDEVRSDQGTITLWTRLNEIDSAQYRMIGHVYPEDAWDNQIFIGYEQDLDFYIGLGDDWERETNIAEFEPHEWRHIALTWTDTTQTYRVYLDGEEVASGSYSGLDSIADHMDIGNTGRVDERDEYTTDGRMEDVRIYDKVLRPDQIQGIYQNGIGLNISATLAPHETDTLFVYHGNVFADRPDYTGTATPSGLDDPPQVIDIGIPRDRDEMLHNLERNVEVMDDRIGPNLAYHDRVTDDDCSIIELDSSYSFLRRTACP